MDVNNCTWSSSNTKISDSLQKDLLYVTKKADFDGQERFFKRLFTRELHISIAEVKTLRKIARRCLNFLRVSQNNFNVKSFLKFDVKLFLQ